MTPTQDAAVEGAGPSGPWSRPKVLPPCPDEIRLLARALDGDGEALRAVLELDDAERLGLAHRLAPALARRARAMGIEHSAVERWRREWVWVGARWLALGRGLEQVGRVLGSAGVPWLPIKGGDLAFRVYEHREDRPASDIDVLVPQESVDIALSALLASGWDHLYPFGRHGEAFIRDEGYNFPLITGNDLLCELHFRLWGMVPAGLVEELFDASTPDPGLGPTGRRPALHHAFLLGALHFWNMPWPRPLLGMWDLVRIARAAGNDLAGDVAHSAGRWGLHLPVLLSAAAAASAWDNPTCTAVAQALRPDLGPGERAVFRRFVCSGERPLRLQQVVAARLLAGRPSRNGLRAPFRRLWAHPGIVERATPDEWPWWRRRLTFTFRPGILGTKGGRE